MEISDIPALNASLNAIATVLIIAGVVSIKAKKEGLHRLLMGASIIVSAIFLIGYVYHKIAVRGVHTPFNGEGAIRYVYYTMLISHILLAAAIPVLVIRTAYLGIKDRRELHKKWARITYPIWLYVSVTGVLVYYFLYVWFQPAAA
ncbi:DUF420 domain-containing protein [Pelagicoccus sp. NFK12]|uniref:DUF420 domain-containing protein n=1 Tax=Pelagicoccus enzymogenes TaxID=2773457 RepID=A0A927FAM0_9BACT|nr:DUF420 domain-containing protein [Pelagicoccus enzymogenes]MBD5780215.1 DUF420 domain-containing protein [Pelagicoccus enzymogenes]MDQ8198522.1 DUF420 domain-containing protein [Pelagicoccus enzymogenes]